LIACGRSQGVADQDLGGLVIAPKGKSEPVDLDRASKDPAVLGRALELPEHTIDAMLGPHTVTISTTTTITEAGHPVSDLTDRVTLELGENTSYHAVYENSADYGREIVWLAGKLYLRPRYQRWHERTPETPDEPERLRDQLTEAPFATWDLLAPGVEVSDLGTAQVAGRAGRKIAVKVAPEARKPAAESLVQRKWREQRVIPDVHGEVVLDVDKGVPLAVKLAGTVEFSRDGRQFAMKLSIDASVSGIGQNAAIAAPSGDDVVATPERLREVDDRDFLLQGIAPPLRKNPDGTAKITEPAPPAGGKPK
jgi:hypothetical protein